MSLQSAARALCANTQLALEKFTREGGLIVTSIKANPVKADRVLCDLESKAREGNASRDAFADFIWTWKQFS